MSLLKMNCNNNGQNLLSTTLFSCPRLLRYEVKHGNHGPTFSSFNAVLVKSRKNIQWLALLGTLFCMGEGTKLQHRIGTKQQYLHDLALLVSLNIKINTN